MAKVIGDISVSVDGFVTGPDPGPAQGLGRGGAALHTWALAGDAVDREVLATSTDATFVPDGIGSAVSKGRAMADDRDVVIMGGAAVIRGALEQNLLDELRLHLSPVLLGAGTPLFAGGPPRTLRQVHVRVSGHATHLTYRVE